MQIKRERIYVNPGLSRHDFAKTEQVFIAS
jgi:hypothetical protein